MTYLFLAVILVSFGVLSAKRPIWALGLLLAVLPSYQMRFQFIIPTTTLELLLVVFLLTTFFARRHNLAELQSLGKWNWAIGLFILAGIVSVFFSPETTKALGQLKAFIIEPILLFYAIALLKKQSFVVPLKLLFWSATAISLFGLIQYFTLLNLPIRFWGNGEEVRRIVSVFEYPNALALYLAPLFIFFTVFLIKKIPLVSRGWFVSGLVIQAVAILLTFSRGAWLGVGIVLAFLLFSHFPLKKTLPVLAIFIILALGAAPIRQRLLVTLNDPSGNARGDLMHAALIKLQSGPVFGNGLYGFRTTLAEQDFQGEILNYPHNIVLNFWLELGLLGLIAFIWIIWLDIKNYKKTPTIMGLASVCFLLVIVIHGLLDVPYFKNDLSLLFWTMLSLSLNPLSLGPILKQ